MWRRATIGKPGDNQHTKVNDNIIDRRPARTQQGTSRAYMLDRLQRDAPALYDAVARDEMSANAAFVEAGFRKRPAPFEQVCKLLPKLTGDERRRLREMLGK